MSWSAVAPVAIQTQPVALAGAKQHCRIDHDDDDAIVTRMIEEAVAHAEDVTGCLMTARVVTAKCDAFSDFARLPFGPVADGASATISFVDQSGATQTLSASVYEVRSIDLDAEIVLKHDQRWPVIQRGSRIALSMTAGYPTLPYLLREAILRRVEGSYEARAGGLAISETDVSELYVNFRRGY